MDQTLWTVYSCFLLTIATVVRAELPMKMAPEPILPLSDLGNLVQHHTFGPPCKMIFADFDSDGNIDMLCANEPFPSMTLLRGAAEGGYSGTIAVDVQAQTTDVVTTDFNGDGLLDYAAAIRSDDLIIGFGNGQGTFHPPRKVPAGLRAARLAVADLNGDGRLDLACAGEGNITGDFITIVFSRASGFEPPKRIKTGLYPHRIVIADFNGDGLPDLVTANYLSGDLTVLTNSPGGQFQIAQSLKTGPSPIDLTVTDFNSDGRPDLAVADILGHSVTILLGTEAGALRQAFSYNVLNLPKLIAAGDINSDGHSDLTIASAHSPQISLLIGKGDGSFVSETRFETPGVPASLAFRKNAKTMELCIGSQSGVECLFTRVIARPDIALGNTSTPIETVVSEFEKSPPRIARKAEFDARVWTTGEGLPENSVQCIFQSRAGDLWIGTKEGVAQFDGRRFHSYSRANTSAMESDSILSIAEDAHGALYLGTTKGILRYKSGVFQNFHGQPNAPDNHVRSIHFDKDGQMWTAGCGPVTVRDKAGVFHSMALTLGCSEVVGGDSRSGIWIGSSYGLYHVDEQKGELQRWLGPVLPDLGHPVEAICPDGAGGIYFSIGGLLCNWNEGRIRAGPLGVLPVYTERISLESNGTMLLTVRGGAVYMIGTNGTTVLDQSAGVPADAAVHLLDREGNLWVGGSQSGLWRFRRKLFSALTTADGLPDDAVWSVCESHAGGVWAATIGGIAHVTGFAVSVVTRTSTDFVFEDKDGQLWFHGPDPERISTLQTGMETNYYSWGPRGAFAASNGDMWIPCQNSIWRKHDGKWTSFGAESGLPQTTFIGVIEEKQGRILVGSYGKGVFCFDGPRFIAMHADREIPAGVTAPVIADPDGAIWIASDRGLHYLDRGHLVSFDRSNGLADDVVLDVVEDDYGWFWINSYHGIFRVRKKQLIEVANGTAQGIRCLTYGLADGILSLEGNGEHFPNSCKTSDGKLWFPTTKGLLVARASDFLSTEKSPVPRIDEVRSNGRLLALTEIRNGSSAAPLEIEPGENGSIEINYSAPVFTSPEKTRFDFKLAGYDRDWRKDEVGAGVAVYREVPPGVYQFAVTAVNSHNVASAAPAMIVIRVLPHFYKTWAFFLTTLILVACLLWGAHVGRVRVIQRIEQLEREAALERERSRIARDMHDEVGASLTRIRLLGELAAQDLNRPAKIETHVRKISQTANLLARDIDEVVWAVDPRFDDLESLISYLAQFTEELLTSASLKCRLNLPVIAPAYPLASETRHNIFLAVKETLNNAVKHAQATEVRLGVFVEAAGVEITVSDNGIGFDQARAEALAGNGLKNVRRRLTDLKGTCRWVTAPGAGTTVTLSIPLEETRS